MRHFKKKSVFTMALLLLIPLANAGAFELQEDWLGEKPEWAPDLSLSTSFLTKYIWRGQNLGDEPVMQYDLSVSKWGFTFDLWGNYTFNSDKTVDGGRYQEVTEQDYTLDYTFNVGEMSEMLDVKSIEVLDQFSFSGGYTYYTFPNADWSDKYFDTHEVYLGVAYDILLQPSFTWYWDVDVGKGAGGSGGNGSYFQGSIGHTFEFDEGVSADLGISAGYNDEQWTSRSGWSDMVFSGGVNVPVFNYFTITPSVAYSLILDKDTYFDAQRHEFYAGITIGFDY